MLKAKPSFHIFLNTESRNEKQHETNTENVFFRKTLTTHILVWLDLDKDECTSVVTVRIPVNSKK